MRMLCRGQQHRFTRSATGDIEDLSRPILQNFDKCQELWGYLLTQPGESAPWKKSTASFVLAGGFCRFDTASRSRLKELHSFSS